jgi:hypothetical protein
MMIVEDYHKKYTIKNISLGHKSHQLLRDFFFNTLKITTIVVTYYTFLGSKK